jgi:hypothetical protein
LHGGEKHFSGPDAPDDARKAGRPSNDLKEVETSLINIVKGQGKLANHQWQVLADR